jgi:hypothetical protein
MRHDTKDTNCTGVNNENNDLEKNKYCSISKEEASERQASI